MRKAVCAHFPPTFRWPLPQKNIRWILLLIRWVLLFSGYRQLSGPRNLIWWMILSSIKTQVLSAQVHFISIVVHFHQRTPGGQGGGQPQCKCPGTVQRFWDSLESCNTVSSAVAFGTNPVVAGLFLTSLFVIFLYAYNQAHSQIGLNLCTGALFFRNALFGY